MKQLTDKRKMPVSSLISVQRLADGVYDSTQMHSRVIQGLCNSYLPLEEVGVLEWIITYDDCQLVRDLYRRFHMEEYGITHNAGGSVQGKEIVITNLPVDRFKW